MSGESKKKKSMEKTEKTLRHRDTVKAEERESSLMSEHRLKPGKAWQETDFQNSNLIFLESPLCLWGLISI